MYAILVKKIREERGLTLKELSRLSGVSESHLSRIERGEKMPKVDTLMNIALALKVDINVLIKREEV